MSTLNKLAATLGRLFAEPARSGVDLDAMNLRQWADLPAYHPRKDLPKLATPR